MNAQQRNLWIFWSALGLVGVASMLLTPLPLTALPRELTDRFPAETLRYLLLINPAIYAVVFSLIGVLLYRLAGFSAPLSEVWVQGRSPAPGVGRRVLGIGAAVGAAAGAAITAVTAGFGDALPETFRVLAEEADPHWATKLLYGGITEELIVRFGLMTLFVWLGARMTGRRSPGVLWTGNALSAVLFALGHFPFLLMVVPDPTPSLYAYVLLGNTVGGLAFGYAYARGGLESAMVAHAVAHLVMMALGAALHG